MLNAPIKEFSIKIPPWPDFRIGNYRFFTYGEKHVTRVCKDFVLLFLLENALFFTEDGSDVEVEAGEWYIQLPGLKQEGRRGSPAPVYYYIHFGAESNCCEEEESSLPKENMGSLSSSNNIFLPVRGTFDQQHFRPLFDQLDYLSKYRTSDILGRQIVFLTILNSLAFSGRTSGTRSQDIAVRVIDYLAANYNRPVTNEELTDIFHFSGEYLTRKMKQKYGTTPWQYIQQLRIEKAKELLANTDYSLAAIAEEIGYCDVSLFYKAFRKRLDIAPGAWRQKYRGF